MLETICCCLFIPETEELPYMGSDSGTVFVAFLTVGLFVLFHFIPWESTSVLNPRSIALGVFLFVGFLIVAASIATRICDALMGRRSDL
jgi:hypothetical protein